MQDQISKNSSKKKEINQQTNRLSYEDHQIKMIGNTFFFILILIGHFPPIIKSLILNYLNKF